MTNTANIEYMNVYEYGDTYVVVETGMPRDNVRIGVGDTLRDAVDALQGTAIQSTGRDCGLSAALEWAEGAGWIDCVSALVEIDDAAERYANEGEAEDE